MMRVLAILILTWLVLTQEHALRKYQQSCEAASFSVGTAP